MPSNKKSASRDFSKFDGMADEELEEILRLDAQKTEGEETDIEMILYVMEVLARRKRNSGSILKSPEEAFSSFQENYLSCGEDSQNSELEDIHAEEVDNGKVVKFKWKRFLTSTAAAIALIICTTFTASAFGVDLLDIVIRWTQDTFQFSNAQNLNQPAAERRSDLQENGLIELLEQYEIPKSIIPIFFPAGYEFEDIQIDNTPLRNEIFIIFRLEDKTLRFSIKTYLETDPESIEKSDSTYEIYESKGINYYLFHDNTSTKAAWSIDNYECYIVGELTIEDMKAVIDSIEKG